MHVDPIVMLLTTTLFYTVTLSIHGWYLREYLVKMLTGLFLMEASCSTLYSRLYGKVLYTKKLVILLTDEHQYGSMPLILSWSGL